MTATRQQWETPAKRAPCWTALMAGRKKLRREEGLRESSGWCSEAAASAAAAAAVVVVVADVDAGGFGCMTKALYFSLLPLFLLSFPFGLRYPDAQCPADVCCYCRCSWIASKGYRQRLKPRLVVTRSIAILFTESERYVATTKPLMPPLPQLLFSGPSHMAAAGCFSSSHRNRAQSKSSNSSNTSGRQSKKAPEVYAI